MPATARRLARWELGGVVGAVVVVDVIRAFSTAAYAFGAGAAEIFLVDTVEEALVLARRVLRTNALECYRLSPES